MNRRGLSLSVSSRKAWPKASWAAPWPAPFACGGHAALVHFLAKICRRRGQIRGIRGRGRRSPSVTAGSLQFIAELSGKYSNRPTKMFQS